MSEITNRVSNNNYCDKELWIDLETQCSVLLKELGLIQDLIKEREQIPFKYIKGYFSLSENSYKDITGELSHLINSSSFDLRIDGDSFLNKKIWGKGESLDEIDFKWYKYRSSVFYRVQLKDVNGLIPTDFLVEMVYKKSYLDNKLTVTYRNISLNEETVNELLDKVKTINYEINNIEIDKRISGVFNALPSPYYYELEPLFNKTKSSKEPTIIQFDQNYNRNARASYDKESKKLVFEINLPVWDEELTASEKKGYNRYIYALVLSMVKNIFGLDYDNEIDTLVFNGRIETYNNVTGEEINPIILSLVIDREEFEKIKNFEKVDPEVWYKKNKGTSAAYLSDMVAIKPHSQIFEEDSRIVESYKVADGLSDDENIATMHWKDFENLVREIFEKEFGDKGFEVKITQSSKDGGVDAIMYDPNPLTGGKIIIQAKRYTNVVGVAAVRDLYGTVINEGANKGILVTTAYYGKDAYNFVKDKPITLIDGPNLLYLLKKHNYSMTIDLEEAKKELKEQGK